MKIWQKTDGAHKEGKFLVVRRDGTIPDWPNFVIGAADPAAPATLKMYGYTAILLDFDPEFAQSVIELGSDFDAYRLTHAQGDPDAPPHRTDNPVVIAMMRREFDVATLIARYQKAVAALQEIADSGALGEGRVSELAEKVLVEINENN